MKFFKVFGKVAQATVPIAIGAIIPESIGNLVLGGLIKHGTAINNQAIPTINIVASTLMSYVSRVIETGDWVSSIIPALQEGVLLTAGSTAMHQGLKITMKGLVTGALAHHVGPGDKFSL